MSNPLNGQISPGGGGVAGLTSANGGTAIADNVIVRGDGATGIQGSTLKITDAGELHTLGGFIDMSPGETGIVGITISGTTNMLFNTNGSNHGLGVQDGLFAVVRGDAGGLGFAPSSNLTTAVDSGLARSAAGVVRVTTGAAAADGWLRGDAGKTRLTGNHTVATNTATLAAINNLTTTVAAGRHYHFRSVLHCTTVNTSGVKVAISGTATHTDIVYDVIIHGISTPAFLTSGRATAKDTAIGVTASGTACVVEIIGTTTINAGGTLLVQAAQNAETGAAESVIVLRGSTFLVQDLA